MQFKPHALAALPALAFLACGVQEQAAPIAATGEGYVLLGEIPGGMDLEEAVAQLPEGGFGVLADPGTGKTATLISTSSPLYARVASGEYSVSSPAACLDCGDSTCASTTRTIGISLLQDSVTPGERYWIEPVQTKNFQAPLVTPAEWLGKVGDAVSLQIEGTLPTCSTFGYFFDVVAEDVPEPDIEQVIISEYAEGSSFHKFIELANTGNVTFDLTGCSLNLYTNGANTPSRTLDLSNTLGAGEVLVLCHPDAHDSVPCDIENNSVINFNGDDPVSLICDGVMVDVIGTPGVRANYGKDVTLRRQCGAGPNATFESSEWDSFPNETWDDIGQHNCPEA